MKVVVTIGPACQELLDDLEPLPSHSRPERIRSLCQNTLYRLREGAAATSDVSLSQVQPVAADLGMDVFSKNGEEFFDVSD